MCCPTENRKAPAWPYWICIALLAALYTPMYWLHPTFVEDSIVSIWLKDFMDKPPFEGLLESYRICFQDFYLWDNGRLANILVIPFVLRMPQWVTALLFGLGAAGMTAMGAKLSAVWRKNFFAFAVLGFCFTFILPYYDLIFVRSYASNYILSSVVSVFAIWQFLKNKTNSALMALLGLIVGAWHEGFAAAVLGSSVMTIIAFKPYRNVRNILFVTGILAGIIYLINSPGTLIRLAFYDKMRSIVSLNGGLLIGIPFYIIVSIYLCSIWWKKIRAFLFIPLPFAIFIATGSGWIVWRAFQADGYRTAWPMLLFASLFYSYIFTQITFTRRRGFTITAFILWSIIFAQLTSTLPWFYRMYKENEKLVRAWKWDGKPVFGPLTTQFDAPWYTFGKPSFSINALCRYSGQTGPINAVIPAELFNFRPEEAHRAQSDIELYAYGKHFVIAGLDTCNIQEYHNITVTIGNETRHIVAILTPFTTANGKNYVWCSINGLYFDSLFNPISRIDFNL